MTRIRVIIKMAMGRMTLSKEAHSLGRQRRNSKVRLGKQVVGKMARWQNVLALFEL